MQHATPNRAWVLRPMARDVTSDTVVSITVTPDPLSATIDWNRDWHPIDESVGDMVDRALEAARRHPERPAVVTPDRPVVTAGDLPPRAAAQAALLSRIAGPDDTVVALVGFDGVGVTLSLASAMADRQVTFVDAEDDHDRMVALIRSLGSLVIADHEHEALLASLPDDIETIAFDATEEADPTIEWARPAGERSARVLSTTSGTTGAPKAAVLPAKRWTASQTTSLVDKHRACRLTIAAIGSYAYVADVVKVICTGNTAAMLSPRRASMRDIIDFMEAARVTSLSVTSTFITAAIRATKGQPFACDVTMCAVRGERVSGDHLAQARVLCPDAILSALYASTEMGNVARLDFHPDDDLPEAGLPVAMPVDQDVTLRWVAADGTIVEDAPPGPAEVVVKPRSLFDGYVGREDDRVEIDGEIWFRSGDLAELLDNGMLRVYGRIGRRVKVGGQFVDLDDVAASFESVEGISLAAVTSFDDPRSGTTRLVGHVVPDDGREIDPVAVRAGLAERLPIFMVPSLIHVVDDPPMARTGKLDEKLLAQWRPAEDTRHGAMKDDFSSSTEAILQVLATELIGVSVRPDDDLIDAGMTSLDWIAVQTRLQDDFGADVALPELYASPTVRAIARMVDHDVETGAMIKLRNGDDSPSIVWVLLGLGAHEAVPMSRALGNRTTWVPSLADETEQTAPLEPDEIVADHVRRIHEAIPTDEPIVITGFSTGTAHAQAVAAALSADGRPPVLLALLDPPRPRPMFRESPYLWYRHKRERFWHFRNPPGDEIPAPRRVFLRQRAASITWAPPPWHGPTVVVRSDQFERHKLPRGLEGPVTMTRVSGGHFDVIAAGEHCAEAIESALDSLG